MRSMMIEVIELYTKKKSMSLTFIQGNMCLRQQTLLGSTSPKVFKQRR